MHWGHAVGDDLVHWQDLPIALTSTPDSPDEDGCFSGCAVDNDGVPTIVHTGVRGQDQLPCVATGSDDLVAWEKYPGNPVISAPPRDLDLVAYRDQAVWREGGTWYQLIGAGIRDVGVTRLLYRSDDLLAWEYPHPFNYRRQPRGAAALGGHDVGVPEPGADGGKHLLIVSVFDDIGPRNTHYPVYFLGTCADHKLTVEAQGMVDHGDHVYAPLPMLDDRGRCLMFGWIWEAGRTGGEERGGAGVMSLPRIVSLGVSLGADGTVVVEPAPELRALRGRHHAFKELDLSDDSSVAGDGVAGDCLEVIARFALGDAEVVGIRLRCSPDGEGEEEAVVRYEVSTGRLVLDRSRSSVAPEAVRDARGGALEPEADGLVRLRVFLDRSVIEVFGNDQTCLSSRIHPSRPGSLGVGVLAEGGTATLRRLDVWEMDGSWEGFVSERRRPVASATGGDGDARREPATDGSGRILPRDDSAGGRGWSGDGAGTARDARAKESDVVMADTTTAPAKVAIALNVNGERRSGQVEPRTLLVHFLRDGLGLTGAHVGCDTSQCGACVVEVDGRSVKSCTLLAVQADGGEVLTIEGLGQDGAYHPIQQAFWEKHGLQCGFCTPGMIMSAYALLKRNPDPTEEEIRHGLAGNLCRCTGYQNIVRSVQAAAETMRRDQTVPAAD